MNQSSRSTVSAHLGLSFELPPGWSQDPSRDKSAEWARRALRSSRLTRKAEPPVYCDLIRFERKKAAGPPPKDDEDFRADFEAFRVTLTIFFGDGWKMVDRKCEVRHWDSRRYVECLGDLHRGKGKFDAMIVYWYVDSTNGIAAIFMAHTPIETLGPSHGIRSLLRSIRR